MSSDGPAVLNPLHLSIVVPVYNEAAMLLAMAEQMAPHFDLGARHQLKGIGAFNEGQAERLDFGFGANDSI